MKKIVLFPILLLVLTILNACSGWDERIDIDFTDPQQIEWVEDVVDEDLLLAMGIENIHFGHTPPNIDDFSFVVDSLWYETWVKVLLRENQITHVKWIDTVYSQPNFEKSKYKHHFFNQNGNIIHQRMYYQDHNQNEALVDCDTTFLIGSFINDTTGCFTAYYSWKVESETQGNPTYAFLVSGTLRYTKDNQNQLRLTYIDNYRIGKKVIQIDPAYEQSTNVYHPGTLWVYRAYHPRPLQPTNWDTPQGRPSI